MGESVNVQRCGVNICARMWFAHLVLCLIRLILSYACNFPLTFENTDEVYAPLRYGDSISLVSEGMNALVVYAGSEDGRPWVQTLQKEVSVPPNLRDCQFRLLPQRSYHEAKKLQRFLQNSSWDAGKGLALPHIPPKGADMRELAHDFVTQYKLPAENEHEVYILMLMLRAKQDEVEGNLLEDQRVQGRAVCYGHTVQLLHVTSEKFFSVTKNRALEGSSKRIILDPDGNSKSAFIIKPAFKTYSDGMISLLAPSSLAAPGSNAALALSGSSIRNEVDERTPYETPIVRPFVLLPCEPLFCRTCNTVNDLPLFNSITDAVCHTTSQRLFDDCNRKVHRYCLGIASLL